MRQFHVVYGPMWHTTGLQHGHDRRQLHRSPAVSSEIDVRQEDGTGERPRTLRRCGCAEAQC